MMSAVEYGQSVAHIVGMSESGHRSCKCGAVYDRSEHIAEVARKISSFECAVCAPPPQCASGPYSLKIKFARSPPGRKAKGK